MGNVRWDALRGGGIGKAILAGIATGMGLLSNFILVPTLLFQAGMEFTGAYTALVAVSIAGTLLIGRVTGQPLVLAPGIPLASWLIYGEIVSNGASWQAVLGASFLASVMGLLLLLSPLRSLVTEAVPGILRQGMVCAVGLMLILQGLMQGRLLVGSPFSVTMLGNLADPVVYLTLIGLCITFALMVNEVPGALAVGTLSVATIALLEGFWVIPDAPFLQPEGLDRVALQLDLGEGALLPDILFPMLLFTLMESTGTLQALHGACPDQVDPPSRATLLCVLGAGIFGALLGSIPSRVAPESAAGLTVGCGRGIAYGTVLFLLVLLFCEPLAREAASFGAIAAPAMVGAGFFMLRSMKGQVFGDGADLASFLCLVILMPLSHDVVTALGAALMAHALLKVFCGKGGELSGGGISLALCFALYFFWG